MMTAAYENISVSSSSTPTISTHLHPNSRYTEDAVEVQKGSFDVKTSKTQLNAPSLSIIEARAVSSLSEIFPDWEVEELRIILEEVAFDVERAASRISEGHVKAWSKDASSGRRDDFSSSQRQRGSSSSRGATNQSKKPTVSAEYLKAQQAIAASRPQQKKATTADLKPVQQQKNVTQPKQEEIKAPVAPEDIKPVQYEVKAAEPNKITEEIPKIITKIEEPVKSDEPKTIVAQEVESEQKHQQQQKRRQIQTRSKNFVEPEQQAIIQTVEIQQQAVEEEKVVSTPAFAPILSIPVVSLPKRVFVTKAPKEIVDSRAIPENAPIVSLPKKKTTASAVKPISFGFAAQSDESAESVTKSSERLGAPIDPLSLFPANSTSSESHKQQTEPVAPISSPARSTSRFIHTNSPGFGSAATSKKEPPGFSSPSVAKPVAEFSVINSTPIESSVNQDSTRLVQQHPFAASSSSDDLQEDGSAKVSPANAIPYHSRFSYAQNPYSAAQQGSYPTMYQQAPQQPVYTQESAMAASMMAHSPQQGQYYQQQRPANMYYSPQPAQMQMPQYYGNEYDAPYYNAGPIRPMYMQQPPQPYKTGSDEEMASYPGVVPQQTPFYHATNSMPYNPSAGYYHYRAQQMMHPQYYGGSPVSPNVAPSMNSSTLTSPSVSAPVTNATVALPKQPYVPPPFNIRK